MNIRHNAWQDNLKNFLSDFFTISCDSSLSENKKKEAPTKKKSPEKPLRFPENICQEFYDQNFIYHASSGKYLDPVYDKSDDTYHSYLAECSNFLSQQARRWPRAPHWDIKHKDIVVDLVKSQPKINNVLIEPTFNSFAIGTGGGMLLLVWGLSNLAPSEEHFKNILKHENGHIQDMERIVLSPQVSLRERWITLKELAGTTLTPEEQREVIATHLKIIKANILDPREKETFEKFASEVLGDPKNIPEDLIKDASAFYTEVLRLGAEIQLSDGKSMAFSEFTDQFKKGLDTLVQGMNFRTPSGKIDSIRKEFIIAERQVAGYWEEFTQQSFFETRSLDNVDWRQVDAIKIAIKAAMQWQQQKG